MSAVKDGGPAFPQKEPLSSDCQGMSLRDYFAAKALVGIAHLTHDELQEMTGNDEQSLTVRLLAEASYEIADAMLAQREKCAAT